jgi:hypothetical protein
MPGERMQKKVLTQTVFPPFSVISMAWAAGKFENGSPAAPGHARD